MVKKTRTRSGEASNLLTLLILFAIIAAILGVVVGQKMYSAARLTLMGFQIPEFGLLTIAMMFSFLLGGIDLSLVANANLAGIVAAYILSSAWFPGLGPGMSILVASLVALAVSVTCGCLNGILIAKFSVPPMIATLSTMTFYTGISMALTAGESVMNFPDAFVAFGIRTVAGVPLIFILFIAVVAVVGLMLSMTALGRRIYLYGANPVAARFSAINNERLIIAVFMLNGLLAGLSGLTIISRITTAKVGYGDAYLTQAMLIAIIGGVSPNGGRGRVTGVLVAVVIIQLLSSAFTIWQLSPYNRKLIWGALLLLVIALNRFSEIYRVRVSSRARTA